MAVNQHAGIPMGVGRAEGWHWVKGKGWVDNVTGEVMIADPGVGTTTPSGPPPGPPRAPSGTSTAGKTYDLSQYSAGAIAEAEQIVNDFGGFIGWPTWFDANAFVKRLLEQGIQADTQNGYQYLWSLMSKDAQKANPNAFFGLTRQQYTEKLNNLADQFLNYTGMAIDELPPEMRNQALSQNWTQSEFLTHLQGDKTLMAAAPWAAVGLSFRDIQSQFGNTYGHAPDSPQVLASWWKFTTGARAVSAGGPAQQTFMPPPSLVQRQPTSDVETR